MKRYFEETLQDVLNNDFKDIYNKYGEISPTVDEYFENLYEGIDNHAVNKILESYKK